MRSSALHRRSRHAPGRWRLQPARRCRSTVCLCPTTERDLADGVGPARRLAEDGARLSIGTDSNALIEPFEEARAVELDERLETGTREGISAARLLRAATADGCAAIGWPDAGTIAPRSLADLVTIRLDGVRLAGTSAEHAVESVVFAAGAADVGDVLVGGGSWCGRAPTSAWTWRRARRLDLPGSVMSSLAIENIGLLVTNSSLGEVRSGSSATRPWCSRTAGWLQ